jgi:hypothetical protein
MAAPRPGAPRRAVIHAEVGWRESIAAGRFDFFVKLEARLRQEGIAVDLVDADSGAARERLGGDGLHIVVGERPAYGPRILHAMPTYVWGFWYLDEVGVHWNSSIRFAGFDPATVDAGRARYFFDGVSGYMLRENRSKFTQAARRTQPLPTAAAVVFCQDVESYRNRCHYLTTEEMIETCAGQGEGRVYVKLHPQQKPARRRQILRLCAGLPRVAVSEASIHDLIAAAGVVVTQNSAAGFEALMQRKSVVTCAKCDFWHATLVARTVDDLRGALARGPAAMAGFEFEKYLYWFLHRHCLEPQKEEFADRAFARIREKLLF